MIGSLARLRARYAADRSRLSRELDLAESKRAAQAAAARRAEKLREVGIPEQRTGARS